MDRVFSGFIGGAVVGSSYYRRYLLYWNDDHGAAPMRSSSSVIVGVTNIIPFLTIHRRYPIGDHFADGQSYVLSDVCYFYCDFLQQDLAIPSGKILEAVRDYPHLGTFLHFAFRRSVFGFVGMPIGVPVFAVIYDLIRQLIIRGLSFEANQRCLMIISYGIFAQRIKAKY